jgi:hypothetical protein
VKLLALSVFTISALLSGCATTSTPDTICTVTAPDKLVGDKSSAQQVALDLSAFARLPVKVDFKNDLKNKFDFAFQKVSDGNARCQMLTQLAACYKGQEKAQSEVFSLISTTKACGG